jgi:hypothetical protein
MGRRDNKEQRADGDRPEAMNEGWPARQVRHASICTGAFVSLSCFALLGACDVVDQWVGGYASATFILGTALIYAGICLAIFGIIAGVGYGASLILTYEARFRAGRDARREGQSVRRALSTSYQ